MLTRKLACPSCGVKLKVADTLPVGKSIQCPKCSHSFPVPEESDEPSSPRVVVAGRRKTARPAEEDEPVDEGKVRRGPRKRRKRRRQTTGTSPWVLALVLGGLVLVLGVGVAFAAFHFLGKDKAPVVAANLPAPRPAPGRPQPAESKPEAGPKAADGASDRFAAGQAVFQTNCARCHRLGSNTGGRRGRGPDLSHVGADPKHTVAWLMEHIRNPQAHNPDSRMPAFEGKIKDDDLRALAEYLASLK